MADTEPTGQGAQRHSSLAEVSQVAQLIAQFVAPATLLAGLLYYWGYFHARGFCLYLGVDSTSLGFSTTEYVMRSADGLFVPIATIAAVALAVRWWRLALPDRLRTRPAPRWLPVVLAIVGGLLLLNGLSQLRFETPLNRPVGVGPACLIAGLLLLWSVVKQRRQRLAAATGTEGPATAPLEWGLVLVLVAGTFFWGATSYSLAVGKGRAMLFEQSLPRAAGLTLFTEKALDLTAPGVVRSVCADPGSAYRYRYDGLVLVLTTSANFVLVPRTWTYSQGRAMVLPRSGYGAVRLEFTRTVPTAVSC
ncbi:hypothetical protein [Nocardia sp. NPDC050406]|uniref:hypothetical protein n=1 Tax=Nocardia sp. NPDC050406 TaxID=3364318 RepID=UPI0037B167C7